MPDAAMGIVTRGAEISQPSMRDVYGVGRNRFINERAGTDNRVIADGYITENDRTSTNIYTVPDLWLRSSRTVDPPFGADGYVLADNTTLSKHYPGADHNR